MSRSIDERIVEMKFDNKQFEGGIEESLASLAKLEEVLNNNISSESLDNISRSANNVDMSGLVRSVEMINERFSALGIVGMTVIQNITNALINGLGKAIHSVTDSIVSGGIKRAMNIENARFQLQGLIKDQNEVDAVMQDAQDSVDGTAYSYDSAAKAASQFAATGLRSGSQMQQALKGISGVAATTNSDYEGVARIFTEVSGQGRLMGDQLLQLSNRGLNAAATLKDFFNGVANGSIKASKGVEDTVKKLSGASNAFKGTAEEYKQSLSDAYEAAAEKFNEEYKLRQKTLNAEYKEVQKTLSKEYDVKKEAYDKEYNALKESLDKEYKAKQKELNEAYNALKKALDAEYEAKKETFDKEYEDLQKSLDAEIEAQQKANSERLKEANRAYQEDVSNYKKAAEEKIALIDKEYTESLKLIDEEAYKRTKALEDQIDAIDKAADEEEKARKQAERNTKLTELKNAVDLATSAEAREKAAKALLEYQQKVAQEELAESRKAQKTKLKEEIAAIKEETNVKKQAAKESRDAAVNSVKEESNATLAVMAEKHEEEQEALQETLQAEINQMKESRNQRLKDLKTSQNAELEALRESQNAQLEAVKEQQSAELEALKESHNNQLSSLKTAQNSELEALKEGQNAQLEALKEKQSEQLEALKKANNDKLKELKRTNDAALKSFSGFATDAGITESAIRDMVSKGLIDFDTFAEAMAYTFGDHAKDANKTFTGSLANIGAALARTGAMFILPLIGQKGEFVQLFNAIRVKINEFNGVLGASGGLAERFTDKVKEIVKVLTAFIEKIDLTGESTADTFANIGTIIGNTFNGLVSIAKVIGESFTEVFGKGAIIKGVQNFIRAIKDLTETFKLSEKNTEDLKKGFTGIFDIIKLVLGIFGKLIEATTNYSSSTGNLGDNILSLVGYIGSALSGFAKLVESSNAVSAAIEAIGAAISFIKDSFGKVIDNISKTLNSFTGVKIDFSKMFVFGKSSDNIHQLNTQIEKLLSILINGIRNVFKPLIPLLDAIKDSVGKMVKNFNPLTSLLYLLNGVLVTDLIANMRNFGSLLRDVTAEPIFAVKRIKASLTELQYTLKAFTLAVDAKALKDIAIAVAILAGSIFVLSSIDPGPLARALGAVSTILGELVGTLTLLEKVNASLTFKGGILGILDAVKINILTSSLTSLALAALLLSVAVKSLADLDWEGLIKGLIGMRIILAELVGVVVILEKTGGPKKLTAVGFGLLLMSAAVIILAQAVKQLSELDIEEIAKGLIAIGGLIAELAIFTELTGGSERMMAIGLGMILVSSAIIILAQAVKQMAELDWEGIGKGLTAVGGLLLELGLFTKLTSGSTNIIGISIGMVILSAALKTLSGVLIELSGLSWEEIAKGLVAIGVALGEVTIALNAMPNTAILKAAGLVVLAEGLKIIGGVVTELAKLSWEEIAKGLVAMGGALLELGLALNYIPPWAILGAAGLVVTAVGLKSIAESMQQFGGMSWEQIAKGLVAMGGALAELVIALKLVNGNLIGAISLAIVASAISDILPMFIQLGNMKWEEIGKACTAMAAALGILAGAIAILSAIGPAGLIGAASLLAFGVALGVAVAAVSLSIGMLVDSIRKMDGVDADAFLKEVEVLAIAIGAIGLALKTFGVTSPLGAAAMKTVAEALLILYPAVMMFSMIDGKTLSETFIKIATGMAEFGLALKAFGPLSNIGATAFNTIADAISKLAPAMIIFMALDLVRVGEVLNALGESFQVFGESLKSFGLLSPLGAEAMSTCATAVAKLAPALFLLKEIEPDVLATTLQTLADAFKGFGEALDATPFWFAKTRAEGIGALIDNIPKLVEVLPAFMDLDPEGTRFALETLADAFCAFGEALDNAPFWSPKERGEAIGVLVQEISTLAEVLPAFMALNPEGTKNALETIGDAFNTFGNALNNAPFWGVTDKGNAIKTLVDSIGTLADGLRNFLTLDAGDVALALLQIHVAFTNFANALNEAPFWGVADKGNAIKTLVDSVGVLADGLRNFLTLNADDVALALWQIHIAFTDFANALNEAPYWGVADRGNAIKTLVESLDTLVPAIASLTEIGADKVKTVMEAIGQGFVNFGESLKASPFWGTKKRSDAIVSLIDSLDSLTDSVIKMSQLSYDTIVQILGAMAGGIKACGNSLKSFDSNAANNTKIFSDLIPIINDLAKVNVVSLQSAIIELGNLGTKASMLSSIDVSGLKTFTTSLSNFIADITKIIGSDTIRRLNSLSVDFVKSSIITPMSSTLTDNTYSIITAVVNIINKIENIIQEDVSVQKAFYDLALRSVNNYMNGIKNKTGELLNTIATMLNNVISTIKSKDKEFNNLGANHAKLYIAAIDSYKNNAYNSGVNLVKMVILGIMSQADELATYSERLAKVFSSAIKSQDDEVHDAAMKLTNAAVRVFNDRNDAFEDCGENAAQGFANGLNNKVDEVAKEARRLAHEARVAIEEELDENSPSKVLRQDGQYAGEGFALGLHDKIREVRNAALRVGQSSVDAFGEAIADITDITEDLDPVITPIVDLSDVMKAADSINDLFSKAVTNVNSNVTSASNSMNRKNTTNGLQNIQNDDGSGNTNVTFIQNNNSPKALSRIDIYRQTRNQLAQFREAVERT